MFIFTLRKLNLFLFTMLLLTILSFSLSFLFPGEQLINISGQINATEQELAILATSYNQEGNIFEQYLAYVFHIFSGDLGVSMSSQTDIAGEIVRLLPATIELSMFAFVIATVIGVPIGFVAAINHNKVTDNVILAVAMIGYSVPVFWLGLLAILTFSIQLGWLPSGGQISLLYEIERPTGFMFIDILVSESPHKWQALQNAYAHIILPAFVIAAAPATVFIRLARSAMLSVLETSYIRATRAKGLSFIQIIFRHAIRNALIKVIQHIGLQFANLVTLAMITEVIFNWPGIGRWLIESIYQRDYTAIQSGLLVLSTFIFIVHIITDYTYAALNPLARGAKYGSR
ncbi:ABC transporter permease subunit [Thalassotalea sp. M1531]|uniref:ABC transporter permease subunit n=1 Tax=Thalassotalea algicola TaxID=2716224 RepID=A0A7Y0LGP4_9GAMM|nr:ABC transporter permease subunit [Thalassotalea algicola]NMP33346.1 ABC transporter permease subunit [Thalassotalea algicola]